MRKVGGITGMVLLCAVVLGAQTTLDRGKKNDAAVAAQSVAPAVALPEKPEVAIRAELDAQVANWNRGDLKGYMQDTGTPRN